MAIQLRKMSKNQKGRVVRISGSGEVGRRIRDMGITKGITVKIVGHAPLYDPIAVKVRNTVLTLRNNEADLIFVETEG